MQQIPLSMISPPQTEGNVVAEGSSLALSPLTEITQFDGSYDGVSGTITFEIPTIGIINITGLPTAATLGTGVKGADGVQGPAGLSAPLPRPGDRGPRGCRGPEGERGAPGARGPRGPIGPAGPTGPTGPKGADGADGLVKIFIMSDDPGPVGAGALWVKP